MKKIGIFYGPQGGNVETVAKVIAEKLANHEFELHLVKDIETDKLNEYSNIIFGISTLGAHNWSSDTTGNDWDLFLPKLKTADLSGKKVALFGLGDHIGYADFFVDAMGDLAEVLADTGAELIGKVSDEGYEFNESRAFVDGKFVGLPLDEDFESELTEERVEKWLKDILPQFNK